MNLIKNVNIGVVHQTYFHRTRTSLQLKFYVRLASETRPRAEPRQISDIEPFGRRAGPTTAFGRVVGRQAYT